MDIFRKYLPLFETPDPATGGAADTATTDAAAVAAAAADAANNAGGDTSQTGDISQTGDQTGGDTGAGDQQQHGNKGRKPWFMDALAEKEGALAQERAARETAEREAANTRQMLDRLQRGDKGLLPSNTTPLPSDEVARQADILANQRMFQTNVNEIIRQGYSSFGTQAFDEASQKLQHFGCATPDFISDVLAVDRANAHKILNDLAADPDTAMQLARLDSRSRIAELTRRTVMAQTKPATPAAPVTPAKGISKAPPPAPPMNTGSRQTKDWRADESSDEEFTAGFFETMEKRAARGRR